MLLYFIYYPFSGGSSTFYFPLPSGQRKGWGFPYLKEKKTKHLPKDVKIFYN